jgi:hypothetical protein
MDIIEVAEKEIPNNLEKYHIYLTSSPYTWTIQTLKIRNLSAILIHVSYAQHQGVARVCSRIEGATWLAWQVPTDVLSVF